MGSTTEGVNTEVRYKCEVRRMEKPVPGYKKFIVGTDSNGR